MITFSVEKLGLTPGAVVADLGAGTGRHTFALQEAGLKVVTIDLCHDDLREASNMAEAVAVEQGTPLTDQQCVVGDVRRLPIASASLDSVVISETLEHVREDAAAVAEIARCVRPGGVVVVTVPAELPERFCWALDPGGYPYTPGGHLRIYREADLQSLLEVHGLHVYARERFHALHSPYWWLRCAYRGKADQAALVAAYHRVLVWDMMKAPRVTRTLERLLNPVLGKSLALYARKA